MRNNAQFPVPFVLKMCNERSGAIFCFLEVVPVTYAQLDPDAASVTRSRPVTSMPSGLMVFQALEDRILINTVMPTVWCTCSVIAK